jgi:hypothetical protein
MAALSAARGQITMTKDCAMKRVYQSLFAICLLSALLLSGCSVESDRSDKPAPDWSRGLRLGTTGLKQPVALQVDAEKHIHMVWNAGRLHYAHLDEQAHVLSNAPLDVDTPMPRYPQLLVDAQDNVHLAWLSRDGDRQALYHVLLTPTAPKAPLMLSRQSEDVSSFRMALSPAGQVIMIWASEYDGAQGLRYASLQALSEIVTLIQPGTDPFVLAYSTGTSHLVWLEEKGLTARSLYYATLQENPSGVQISPPGGHRLTDFEFALGAVIFGPIIGLDDETVHILWSEQNLGGGLTPTAAFSYYVAFQPGQPSTGHARTIGLPTEPRPSYEDHSGPYGLTRLDPLSPADLGRSGDFINSPATVSSQGTELPVAFSLMTQGQSGSEIQLATAVLARGEQVGYQLASKTENASLMPSLVADADADLHMAWIDTSGFKTFDVYYASTAPQAKQWLDRTSADDLAMGAAEVVFGMLSGIGLLPIAGVWSFPPVVWIVVFFIATGQEEMDRRPTKIGFSIAVVLYVSIKVLLLPGLFAGTPLLHLVPRGWATFVGIAVPVVVFLLALLSVLVYMRRSERATIFKAFFIFALLDVSLTLILYAPGFFGQT